MKELIGTGVALVTPFTSEGKVDVDGLKNVVNFQIDMAVQMSMNSTSRCKF